MSNYFQLFKHLQIKLYFLQMDNNELKHIKIGLEMEIYII